MPDERILFVPVGDNPARLFGMDARRRACRLAENLGLECAETIQGAGVLANMAYAWDPAWLREIADTSSISLLPATARASSDPAQPVAPARQILSLFIGLPPLMLFSFPKPVL